jgi:hypothetical protein
MSTRKCSAVTGIAGSSVAAAVLTLAFLTMSAFSADARGHGFNHAFAGRGVHGPQFAGGRRHDNDNYIKAASQERDKLLSSQIKSICRGC